MKILNVKQGSEEWHEARREKITGTKLKNVKGTKIAQYQQMAELIAETRTERSKVFRVSAEMERGLSEEPFAIKRFTEITGKKVFEVGLCISEENDFWINSPDGLIKPEGMTELEEGINEGVVVKEAVEVKSLNSENQVFHEMLNAFPNINKAVPVGKRHTIGVPKEYEWQCIDYFVVNPDLEILHFIYWDSRVIDEEKQLVIIEVKRENEIVADMIKDAITSLLEFEKEYLLVREVLLKNNF